MASVVFGLLVCIAVAVTVTVIAIVASVVFGLLVCIAVAVTVTVIAIVASVVLGLLVCIAVTVTVAIVCPTIVATVIMLSVALIILNILIKRKRRMFGRHWSGFPVDFTCTSLRVRRNIVIIPLQLLITRLETRLVPRLRLKSEATRIVAGGILLLDRGLIRHLHRRGQRCLLIGGRQGLQIADRRLRLGLGLLLCHGAQRVCTRVGVDGL